MSIVVDASVAVAALIDSTSRGSWARQQMRQRPLAAPHVMPAETTNILRRAQLTREVTRDMAVLAHRDLLRFPVELYPFHPFARRVWQLRDTVTAYDAWYVALAEALSKPLVTLDLRLTRAPGPTCRFRTPTL